MVVLVNRDDLARLGFTKDMMVKLVCAAGDGVHRELDGLRVVPMTSRRAASPATTRNATR
jgi:hypothetical protein